MPKIAVIISSTREARFADRPAKWVTEALAATPDVEVDLVDLRDHPLPFLPDVSPLRYKRDYPTPELAGFGQRIDAADGFVILTSEYNHGYTGVLKNAMDQTFVEWGHKPVSFVGWGSVGGARAIEQLRSVAVEFEMAPLRHAVHILPDVLMPARALEPGDTSAFAPLADKLNTMIADLLWWTGALATARASA